MDEEDMILEGRLMASALESNGLMSPSTEPMRNIGREEEEELILEGILMSQSIMGPSTGGFGRERDFGRYDLGGQHGKDERGGPPYGGGEWNHYNRETDYGRGHTDSFGGRGRQDSYGRHGMNNSYTEDRFGMPNRERPFDNRRMNDGGGYEGEPFGQDRYSLRGNIDREPVQNHREPYNREPVQNHREPYNRERRDDREPYNRERRDDREPYNRERRDDREPHNRERRDFVDREDKPPFGRDSFSSQSPRSGVVDYAHGASSVDNIDENVRGRRDHERQVQHLHYPKGNNGTVPAATTLKNVPKVDKAAYRTRRKRTENLQWPYPKFHKPGAEATPESYRKNPSSK